MTWKYLQRYLNENSTSYTDYLKSEHWQDLRRRYWASKLHDRTCYACHAGSKPLEVHHKTYKRIGHERLNDLCLLCRDCHQSAHDWDKQEKQRTGRSHLFGAARHIKKVVEWKLSKKTKKRWATFTAANEPGHKHTK